MRYVPAGEFKIHCLSILDNVAKRRETVVVTKHRKPVATIQPFEESGEPFVNPLKGSVIFEEDIIAPIDDTDCRPFNATSRNGRRRHCGSYFDCFGAIPQGAVGEQRMTGFVNTEVY